MGVSLYMEIIKKGTEHKMPLKTVIDTTRNLQIDMLCTTDTVAVTMNLIMEATINLQQEEVFEK